MRWRGFLHDGRGNPKVFVPALVVLVVTIVLGLVALRVFRHEPTEVERAAFLSRSGRFAAAEAIYLRLLKEKPSVPVVLASIENHRRASRAPVKLDVDRPEREHLVETVMSDDDFEALLATSLPEDIGMIARFAFAAMTRDAVDPELRAAILIGAMRDPPLPWHNHILGVEAAREKRLLDAANHYQREGLTFPERRDDVDYAIGLLIEENAWDLVHERMQDPRISSAVEPPTKYRIAVHESDWVSAVKAGTLGWESQIGASSFVMSAIAALAWAFFCARLGKLGERPLRRGVFYVLAFVLGVSSVVPTMFLIAVEEAKLHLVETGEPMRDAIFYVFGVGLREEASKLLLFLPLLPILRRWGDKLDVLVCGAVVGLGFAAEENLGYLASGDLHTGLARFVTANFFHMAMTGILATALDDFVRDTERHGAEFTRATLLVVGLHGAYDYLLTHSEFGGPYMAMFVFVFLTRTFLNAVDLARGRKDRGLSLVHSFVFATAVVTGVTAVRAFAAVGATNAIFVMSEGLLGVAIILVVFVRTLSTM